MAIIEVERKFLLKPRQCLPWSSSRREEFVDKYYDTPSFDLTGKNWWLRSRAGRWELKIGRFIPKRATTMYEELTSEKGVANRLDFTLNGRSLAGVLTESGYAPFAELETERELYENRNGFIISVDTVTAEGNTFNYKIVEIELQVPEEERDSAAEQIHIFSQSLGLDDRPVRGKLIEYLRLYRPDHFKFLLDQGVIAPELAI